MEPGGALTDRARRAPVLTEAGWDEERVDEVVFEQPRGDPDAAFEWVDSGFAEPLRTAPSRVRERVWMRFKALYRAEPVEEHRVLLLRLVPSSS